MPHIHSPCEEFHLMIHNLVFPLRQRRKRKKKWKITKHFAFSTKLNPFFKHRYMPGENFSNIVTWMGYFSADNEWHQTIWFPIRVYAQLLITFRVDLLLALHLYLENTKSSLESNAFQIRLRFCCLTLKVFSPLFCQRMYKHKKKHQNAGVHSYTCTCNWKCFFIRTLILHTYNIYI